MLLRKEFMKQKIQLLLICVAFLFCSISFAAPIFRFSQNEELRAIGISLPTLQGSVQEPLKTPEVAVYQFTRGNESWTEERYSADELWFGSQHIGTWKDSNGNVLQLARCTNVLSDEYVGTDVQQTVFDTIVSKEAIKISTGRFLETKQALSFWLKRYSSLSVVANPMDIKFGNQRLVEAYKWQTNSNTSFVCFFKLNKQFPGQGHAPENWFCVIFVSARPLTNEAVKYIQENLIRRIAVSTRATRTGPYSVNKNRTRIVKQYPYSAVRERAKKSIEALNDWWYMESENFIMLSNHARAERAAEEILNELELLRSYYVKLFPPFDGVEKMDVGVVRFFATTEEYVAYLETEPLVGLNALQTAGIFTAGRAELVIRNVLDNESYKHSIISPIIKHEGLHQYFYLAFGYLQTAPWFNEGHACMFENTKLERGNIFIQEDEARFKKVRAVIKDMSDSELEQYIAQFLLMDYRAFYSVNHEFNYALAHCLVYYLHRGAPLERNQPYRDIIPRYIDELSRSGDMIKASQFAFSEIEFKSFVRRFAEFMKNSKLRQDALRRPL